LGDLGSAVARKKIHTPFLSHLDLRPVLPIYPKFTAKVSMNEITSTVFQAHFDFSFFQAAISNR
jgi:hypothetical protein